MSFVHGLICGEREEEEEDKDGTTRGDNFAIVQQFGKGKGKGSSNWWSTPESNFVSGK